MLFDEDWNKEQLERMKLEYYDDGHEAGVEDGINKRNTEVARELIKKGFDNALITDVLKVTPRFIDPIRKEITENRN